jgi:hypothetical protein
MTLGQLALGLNEGPFPQEWPLNRHDPVLLAKASMKGRSRRNGDRLPLQGPGKVGR